MINDLEFEDAELIFDAALSAALQDGVRGQPLAELLRPEPEDYFVLKPKHSAFVATTMDTLLRYLGARSLILTGIAPDICVLFSANDAYMRDFELYVPADCVAANCAQENEHAPMYIERVLKANIQRSDQLDLGELTRGYTSTDNWVVTSGNRE